MFAESALQTIAWNFSTTEPHQSEKSGPIMRRLFVPSVSAVIVTNPHTHV
jgi:hypothetical protein